MIELTFEPSKETKGTWKFEEVLEGLAEAKVGTLYVRKSTLAELGLTAVGPETRLSVTIEAS